jgi:hypothetical protein
MGMEEPGAERISMADEVGGGIFWKRGPKKAVQGGFILRVGVDTRYDRQRYVAPAG